MTTTCMNLSRGLYYIYQCEEGCPYRHPCPDMTKLIDRWRSEEMNSLTEAETEREMDKHASTCETCITTVVLRRFGE